MCGEGDSIIETDSKCLTLPLFDSMPRNYVYRSIRSRGAAMLRPACILDLSRVEPDTLDRKLVERLCDGLLAEPALPPPTPSVDLARAFDNASSESGFSGQNPAWSDPLNRGRLNEYLQRTGRVIEKSTVREESVGFSEQGFIERLLVDYTVGGRPVTLQADGTGRTKKEAQRMAAFFLLRKLREADNESDFSDGIDHPGSGLAAAGGLASGLATPVPAAALPVVSDLHDSQNRNRLQEYLQKELRIAILAPDSVRLVSQLASVGFVEHAIVTQSLPFGASIELSAAGTGLKKKDAIQMACFWLLRLLIAFRAGQFNNTRTADLSGLHAQAGGVVVGVDKAGVIQAIKLGTLTGPATEPAPAAASASPYGPSYGHASVLRGGVFGPSASVSAGGYRSSHHTPIPPTPSASAHSSSSAAAAADAAAAGMSDSHNTLFTPSALRPGVLGGLGPATSISGPAGRGTLPQRGLDDSRWVRL